ncbi:MAG: hypothetical protein RBS72_12570 [Sedimentisphaerales bacterium]|nr:hypothetical protein [Sedimentisphaerales bacterium]HNY78537.1 hypothetical protein [Sedimentisphaerales bacterium]HOC63805.1 hypothetical protein [Sedimentisphaerales bacterium]HOH64519.1 hypothetical protein [Sedimentisphaerales bacterium]HPY49609.1 hypothetical protein [Sedimentisphaerales bacterium]
MTQSEEDTLFVQCEGYGPYVERLTLPRTGIGRAATQQSPRIIRLNPR